MPSIVVLVEGEGDAAAVPKLVAVALRRLGRHDWFVVQKQTTKVGGVAALKKRLDSHAGYLRIKSPDAALVLLDLEDGCPKTEATELAGLLRGYNLPFPVAVVLAHREYEAWFLASLETIAPDAADLPSDAEFSDDPEGPRGCKERLTAMMPAGKTYRETTHQAEYTSRLDFDLAQARSRSFRRFVHAVDQVTTVSGSVVTP